METTQVTEAYIAAGLVPADEVGPSWVGDRWDAAAQLSDGFLLASQSDGRVYWQVTTESGVIRTEGQFGDDPIGLAMFAAACSAVL